MVRVAADSRSAATRTTGTRSAASSRTAVAVGAVVLDRRSTTDFRVTLPISGAPTYKRAEYRFTQLATGVFSLNQVNVIDVRDSTVSVALALEESVLEFTQQVGYLADPYPNVPPYHDFQGMGHGSEIPILQNLKVNGVTTTIEAGSNLAGTTVTLTQSITNQKPTDPDLGVTWGSTTLVHTITTDGVTVDRSQTVDEAYLSGATQIAYRAGYAAMLTGRTDQFDRSQSGSNAPITYGADGDVFVTGEQETSYGFLNSTPASQPYQFWVVLTLGVPEATLGWSLATPLNSWAIKHAGPPPYMKRYVNWIKDTVTAAPATHRHQQRYEVRYVAS